MSGDLNPVRMEYVAANPDVFLYQNLPESLDRHGVDQVIADVLEESKFEPLFSDARLLNIRDFVIHSPDEGVNVDFRRSYEKLLAKPEGPKAGATVGIGYFDGVETVIFAAQNVRGAAVGEVEGELMVQAFKIAGERNLPIVSLIHSGGMDQTQGPAALTQMTRTSTAMEIYKETCDQPCISILFPPTLGGTPASTAFNGDISAAVGGRGINGFTGERIQELMAHFVDKNLNATLRPIDQSALTNMLNGNGIDLIIQPHEVSTFISRYLSIAAHENTASVEDTPEEESRSIKKLLVATGSTAISQALSAVHKGELRTLPIHGDERLLSVLEPVFKVRNPITQIVHRNELTVVGSHPESKPMPDSTKEEKWARDLERHTGSRELEHIDTLTILDHAFDNYVLLRNPQEYANRVHMENIVTAMAEIDGKPVIIIGQQPDHEAVSKGSNGDFELQRKYSKPTPADWRRVTNAVKHAERRGIPVVTLLDSPGAASDRLAEAGGQAKEMSDALAAISGAKVPVLTYVIGAAGSGGAICMAATYPQPRALDTASIFVAAPIATAAIYRDRTSPPTWPSGHLVTETTLAAQVGVEAWVGESTVFRGIITTDPDPRITASKYLREAIRADLEQYGSMTPAQLLEGKLARLSLTSANIVLTPA